MQSPWWQISSMNFVIVEPQRLGCKQGQKHDRRTDVPPFFANKTERSGMILGSSSVKLSRSALAVVETAEVLQE
jgi:hypothetical protein